MFVRVLAKRRDMSCSWKWPAGSDSGHSIVISVEISRTSGGLKIRSWPWPTCTEALVVLGFGEFITGSAERGSGVCRGQGRPQEHGVGHGQLAGVKELWRCADAIQDAPESRTLDLPSMALPKSQRKLLRSRWPFDGGQILRNVSLGLRRTPIAVLCLAVSLGLDRSV